MFSIILEARVVVNLFLVLWLTLISHTVPLNFWFKRRVSIVQLNGTPFDPGEFDCELVVLHSVSIMLDLEPFVNGFLKIFGSFLKIFCKKCGIFATKYQSVYFLLHFC